MSYTTNNDAPLLSTTPDQVYTVRRVGPGQAMTATGEAMDVVVVEAVNKEGHVITLMLDDEDREMIDRCSGMDINGPAGQTPGVVHHYKCPECRYWHIGRPKESC